MKRKTMIPVSPVRDMIKRNGDKDLSVTEDAVLFLIKCIEDFIVSVSEESIVLMKHSNRKRLSKKDIELAIKVLDKKKT